MSEKNIECPHSNIMSIPGTFGNPKWKNKCQDCGTVLSEYYLDDLLKDD